MPREIIKSSRAPQAVGAYSQAVRAGDFVFVSGQIPLNPETGEVVFADIKEQTERILVNIRNILQEAGMGLEDVVKTTVFMADLADFARMNEVYGRRFPGSAPARSTVQVAALPRDARVEIEVVAVR